MAAAAGVILAITGLFLLRRHLLDSGLKKNLNNRLQVVSNSKLMQSARPSLFRTVTALVTLLAWLAISNHCALAAIHFGKEKPVCSSCHDDGQKDSPKSSSHEVACCKVLKAVEGKALWQPITTPTGMVEAVVFVSELSLHPQANLDTVMPTGPPRTVTSSALIFQRYHWVNAPPFLA